MCVSTCATECVVEKILCNKVLQDDTTKVTSVAAAAAATITIN